MQSTKPWIGAVAMAAAMAGWTSCGMSGEDDGGRSFSPPPPLPRSATWQLDSVGGGLTASLELPTEVVVTVTLPVVNLAGDWDTVTQDLVVRNGRAASVALRIVAPALLPADVTFSIDDPLSLPAVAEHPSSGSFEVAYGAHVVRGSCSAAVVELDLDSGAETATLPWDVFDSVDPGGTEPEYQQVAAFAHSATMFVLEQLDRVVEGLDLIRADEEDFVYASPGTWMAEHGDYFPPIERAGLFFFGWVDDGSPETAGEPGPGDDFIAEFDDYWIDDPQDPFDDLLEGVVRLVDYGESASPFFLGFDEIRFERFVVAETEEVSAGVYELSAQTELNGSLKLGVFAANTN